MKRFATLISELDSTTKTSPKIKALVNYLNDADDQDKMWCIALFNGKRPKRTIKTSAMREWCAELTGLPLWLIEDSYHIVGDLAECISLLLPEPTTEQNKPLHQWLTEIQAQKTIEEHEIKEWLLESWSSFTKEERFVFNKLITGGFRIGVSGKNMIKALATHLEKEETEVAHRLMGNWSPQESTFQELFLSSNPADDLSKPYPFYLAYPLETEPKELGPTSEWQIESKWDGIRGQLIKRNGEIFIWSRGEELVTDKYPELTEAAAELPDGIVLDGEIIAHNGTRPLPFHFTQKRIGRKSVGKKIREECPIRLIAYDILELDGNDIRSHSTKVRREKLEEVFSAVQNDSLLLSPLHEFPTWEEYALLRSQARENYSEGLMLKRKNGDYKVGRKRGDWFKWKVEPLTIDAVLIYAMRGHGRRANLFTDYTFAVWDGDRLVPVTKAYSGLTDEEFRKVDSFVKKNTIEKFGPVRSVKPELVFEIAFEGIAASTRHKSGIALRFPRMKRRRLDKKASEANTLSDLKAMLSIFG